MSDQLFDLLVHNVKADTNTHNLAEKLSKLLGVGVQQLEMSLVKVKLSSGNPESIATGLTKVKAEKIQTLLAGIGLETSLKEGISLAPIKKEIKKYKFTCPACGVKQITTKKEADQVCASCGLIMKKYEEVQGIKKYEEDVIKHNKLIDEQEKIAQMKAKQDKQKKKLNNQLKTRTPSNIETSNKNNSVVLIAILGICIIGSALFFYLDSNKKETEVTEVKPAKKELNAASPNNQAIQNSQEKQNIVAESQGLANPYSKFANPAAKKISMADGVKKINTLLKNTKLKLPSSDKSALKQISQIYIKANTEEASKPDFSSIKQLSKTIKNKKARNTVNQVTSWGELENGLKTFDELGIQPATREGDDATTVQVSNKLINVLIRVNEFDKAIEEAMQINNQYLKAIALNKIMRAQVKEDMDGAINTKEKIEIISKSNNLDKIQKILISGILGQEEIMLGNKTIGQKILKQTQLSVKQLKKPVNQVLTLIQLSEDQREGLNFEVADLFLEKARQKLDKQKLASADKDKALGLLAKQYANLLDFDLAKKYTKKIRNEKKKNLVAKHISIIEIKASADYSNQG